MFKRSDVWNDVEKKQQELKALLEDTWKQGEYHIAAIGEGIVRTAENSLLASQKTILITNQFLDSIKELESLIQDFYKKEAS